MNYINREISWLSFNYRVLQEAKDKSVPLYERIKFLAIYSSNLDEFFRVRVAGLRSLLGLKNAELEKLSFDPANLLNRVHNIVHKQQEEFGAIFRDEILVELKENYVFLISEKDLTDKNAKFIKEYFYDNVLPNIQPALIEKDGFTPFLHNRRLYLAVKLRDQKNKSKEFTYALVEIPTLLLPRFVQIPSTGNKTQFIFLDDIIRFCLPEIFKGFEIVDSYSIKLTRDADLQIDDEFSGNLLSKIKKGLKKRQIGLPSRFLYDLNMPKDFLDSIIDILELNRQDTVPGGRYHNFNDFFSFPNPGLENLEYSPLPELKHKVLDDTKRVFNAITEKDQLLAFPYQSYDYVVKMLDEAAEDPAVKSIRITQYRVASNSAIVNALIKAAKNGKDVIAFVELKARFDEELNIQSAEAMEDAGIMVYYSFPGLKVHAKIAIITREIEGKEIKTCYLATGNFNEKTAKIYCDYALLTADKNFATELEKVFDFLSGRKVDFKFRHLLVAQFNMRKAFTKMIDNEIANVQEGKEAAITLKMNSLEDKKMISKLYEANNAGVKVTLIIRGVCCLITDAKGLSENVKAISIVDRFLEHSRVFMFHNDGEEKIYLGSADWMKRNLNRRVEVAFPIYDKDLRNYIKDIIALQLDDNTHSRIIDNNQSNPYIKNERESLRSQYATYDYIKKINS